MELCELHKLVLYTSLVITVDLMIHSGFNGRDRNSGYLEEGRLNQQFFLMWVQATAGIRVWTVDPYCTSEDKNNCGLCSRFNYLQ